MTEFSCKICGIKVKFDPKNSETYIQKSISGNPLIGRLFVYRISHKESPGVYHVNVIVVDEQGQYRAHKDAYEDLKTPTSFNQWQTIVPLFPPELRPYLALADPITQQQILEFPPSLEQSPITWMNYFTELWNIFPYSNLISLLAAKWYFIVGQGKKILERKLTSSSWSYIIALRIKSRVSPSPELISEVNNLNFDDSPDLFQAEFAVAKAEVFLRLSAFTELEQLYHQCQARWNRERDQSFRINRFFVQAYYGFGLYRQGKLKEGLKLLEPAFNFAQLLDHREMENIVGSLYAQALRIHGDVSKALKIYQINERISEILGSERGRIVCSTNIGIIKAIQGSFEEALQRFKVDLESPAAQRDIFLKIPIIDSIARSLYELQRYQEAVEFVIKALDEENLPIHEKVFLLDILRMIALKTESKEFLRLAEKKTPEHEFFNSPQGKMFKLEMEAAKAELANNWSEMIKYLEEKLEIVNSNALVELAPEVEIRLAEAYFELYRTSKDKSHLDQVYKHLDLTKTIAQEVNYFPQLCQLSQLKGLVAAEAGTYERAEYHLKEALELAEQHSLQGLKQEIQSNLDALEQGKLVSLSYSVRLRHYFTNLRKLAPSKAPKSTEEEKLLSLWIKAHETAWESIYHTTLDGTSEHVYYLLGMRDLWRFGGKNIVSKGVTSIEGRLGTVLVEESKSFVLLALCTKGRYHLRLKLRDILNNLDDFPLKYIEEELTGMCDAMIQQKLGELTRKEF